MVKLVLIKRINLFVENKKKSLSHNNFMKTTIGTLTKRRLFEFHYRLNTALSEKIFFNKIFAHHKNLENFVLITMRRETNRCIVKRDGTTALWWPTAGISDIPIGKFRGTRHTRLGISSRVPRNLSSTTPLLSITHRSSPDLLDRL